MVRVAAPLKRLGLVLGVLACVGVAGPAPRAQDSPLVKHRFISIGTGGAKGNYQLLGAETCRVIEARSMRDYASNGRFPIRCFAPSTSGSIFNLRKVRVGVLTFALVQSDWPLILDYVAELFPLWRTRTVASVFAAHREPLQLVVRGDSTIQRFSDLVGRRFSLGQRGSGQRGAVELLLSVHGLTHDDFDVETSFTSDEQAQALCAGAIDAYIAVTGVPNASVADAIARCGARLVALDSAQVRKLVEDLPAYDFVVIERGSYEGLTEDIRTYGPTATLVTTARMDDTLVGEVAAAVLENLDALRRVSPAFAELDPLEMTRYEFAAPLHPAARRYYEERGWIEGSRGESAPGSESSKP